MCSDVCLSACRCGGIDFIINIYDVSLLGPLFCIHLVFSARVRMFDLSNLGSGRSEGASGRTQIHPICRT